MENIRPTQNLIAYTNHEIKTLGKSQVMAKAFNTTLKLPIYVVEQNDVPLFGLDWCLKFKLPLPAGSRLCQVGYTNVHSNIWEDKTINSLDQEIATIISEFSEIFDGQTKTF